MEKPMKAVQCAYRYIYNGRSVVSHYLITNAAQKASDGTVATKFGGFDLSRSYQLAGRLISPIRDEDSHYNPHVPLKIIGNPFTPEEKKSDAIVAIQARSLPEEIESFVEQAGIKSDISKLCGTIVFCTYIAGIKGEWADGFIVEKEENCEDPLNPFSLPKPDRDMLSSGLFDIDKTVFLNFSGEKSSERSDFEHFTSFTYYLGYLKVNQHLRSRHINPDHVTFKVKQFLAYYYLFDALTNLPATTPNISDYTSRVYTMLQSKYKLLNDQEKILARQEAHKMSPNFYLWKT